MTKAKDPLIDALDLAGPSRAGSQQRRIDAEFGPDVQEAIIRAYERKVSPADIAKRLSATVPISGQAVRAWLKDKGVFRERT